MYYRKKTPFTTKEISVLLKWSQPTLDWDSGKNGETLFIRTCSFLVITRQRQLSVGVSFPGVLSGNDLARKEKLAGCSAHMSWLRCTTRMCHLWYKIKHLSLDLHKRNPEDFIHSLEGDCSCNILLFWKALQEQNWRKLAVNLVVV